MFKSIRFTLAVCLFFAFLFFNGSMLYSQKDGDCDCKVKICACCNEDGRTFQIYYQNGTPFGTPFTMGEEGCAPTIGEFNLPCFTTFYVEDVTFGCPTPLRTYFTTCVCWPNGSGEMRIEVQCCSFGDKPRNENGAPMEFKLNQNFPNPFNPVTKINFELPVESNVKITIYDVNGKVVDTPLNASISAGYHELIWSADRLNLSSGIYFYKLEAGTFTEEKKMVLVK